MPELQTSLPCITAVLSLAKDCPISFRVHRVQIFEHLSNKARTRGNAKNSHLTHSNSKLERICPMDPRDVVSGHPASGVRASILNSRSLSLVILLPTVFL